MQRYRRWYLDNGFSKMEPESLGEWVKWEDYSRVEETYEKRIRELNDKLRRYKTSNVVADGGVLKVRDVAECNCQSMLFHKCHDGVSVVSEWVCPKHGYKRR